MTSLFSHRQEQHDFAQNLGMMLSAGTTIPAALESLAAESRSARVRQTTLQLKNAIESGSPVWQALEQSRLVPEQVVAVVRIGEASGRLHDNLLLAATQLEKEQALSAKIRNAAAYPILVLSLAGVIALGIAWFILPRLAGIFSQLHIKLPLMTRFLIGLGQFLGHYGLVVIPLLVLLGGSSLYLLFINPKTKELGERLLARLPGIKTLLRDTELARFGYLLGTLLQAGLPVVEAMTALAQTTHLARYRSLYRFLQSRLATGNSFRESFRLVPQINQLLPIAVQQMIGAAEQSGKLPETFLKISQTYERLADETAENLTVILEPLLLVIVWVAVLFVALSVIVPIYGLIGGFNTS